MSRDGCSEPWTVTQDNESAIEVTDDSGGLVLREEFNHEDPVCLKAGTRAQIHRAVACVNHLARHPSLPGVITLSAEEAGRVRSLLDKALVEIASTGAPFLNGKYHKGGEWSFTEMTERNNPADADAIKSGFLALKEAVDLITRAQKEG